MRRLITLFLALGLAVAGIIVVTMHRPSRPSLRVTHNHLLTACGSLDCRHNPAILTWRTIRWAHTSTGYYVFLNNAKVADVPGTSYSFTAMNCGSIYQLGVQAHDSARPEDTSRTYTTNYTTPPCSAVNRFCNIAAAYTNLTTGPHLCGWPDSTNTGYENASGYLGSLTVASGSSPTCPTTYQSNHTYSFCEYTDSPTFPSDLTNVTFYGDSFESNAVGDANVRMSTGDNNIVFNYDTFKPLPSVQASPPITDCTKGYQYGIFSTNAEGYTLEHSDMWGFAEAVDTAGSTQANPQIFEDNWLHDAAPGYPYYNGSTCGFHIDGIGYQEGCGTSNCLPSTESYAVIDDNTMEFLGNGNIIAWQQGSYDHLQATNNLLSGDNQPMAGARCISTASSVCKPPSYITTTGNTLSTYLQYSPPGGDYPIDNAGGGMTNATSTWNHNYWAVPPGAAWGTPAYNGYYWVPTTNSSGDPKDCGFVSKTDWPNYTNPTPAGGCPGG